MQSRGNGVKKAKNGSFPEARRTLKAHDLYLGSMLFITKSSPSPAFRTNLFMNYDLDSGRILVPSEIDKPLNKLDVLLSGRTENTKIEVMEDDTLGDL